VASDSKSAPRSINDLDTSVIENEIPAYRAVSAGAVTSLVLGLASVFCFTSLWFLTLVAASILFGWNALRTIRRLPDILTGTGLAKAGIGFGLIFGLTSVTQIVVQDVMLNYEAGEFAKMYVNVLKSEPLPLAAWYLQPPDYRKDKSPDEVVDEMKKTKNPSTPDAFGSQTKEIQAIKERLKEANQEIHFSKIESKLVDGLTQYANALVDLDGPGTKANPEKEQFALIDMIKTPGGGRLDWRIRSIRYPYEPATAGVQAERKDDGHGHSH